MTITPRAFTKGQPPNMTDVLKHIRASATALWQALTWRRCDYALPRTLQERQRATDYYYSRQHAQEQLAVEREALRTSLLLSWACTHIDATGLLPHYFIAVYSPQGGLCCKMGGGWNWMLFTPFLITERWMRR